MKCKKAFSAILLGGTLLSAGNVLGNVWDSAASFSAWQASKNVMCKVEGNALKLTGIGIDPGIKISNLNIDTAKYKALRYTYRAKGTSNRAGQLFFAGADAKYAYGKHIDLPRLIADNKLHTVTVEVPDSWKKFGKVVNLRFDPTDGAGGEIEITKIELVPVPVADKSLVWNSANKFNGWDKISKCTTQVTSEGLQIKIQKADSWISHENVEINTADIASFSFRYKATGVKKSFGQLFFAGDGNFGNNNFLLLPQLICDNQWHTVRIVIGKLTPRYIKVWNSVPVIKKLRFDVTDSATGTVTISDIKFEKTSAAQAADLPAVEPVWNTAAKLAEWGTYEHLTVTPQGNTLKLAIQKGDPKLYNKKVNFVPGKYNAFSFRYRAVGVSSQFTGQMYYSVDGKTITANSCWPIPALRSDNQWHTVTVTLDKLKDPKSWVNGKRVTQLRFDVTDAPAGSIEIADIKFFFYKGKKSVTGYTAEQFDADVWSPEPAGFQPLPTPVVAGAYYKGKVISAQEDLQPHEVLARKPHVYNDFFLRKEFTLKAKPVKAYIQVMADDRAKFYLNGKYVVEAITWEKPVVLDVAKYLKAGKNVWAVHYRNGGNVGGVFGELFAGYADGSFERIDTDEKFLSTVIPPDDWNQLECSKKTFSKVVTLPAPPAPPWKRKLAYNNYAAEQKLIKFAVPAVVDAGSTKQLALEFEGNMPECPFYCDIFLRNEKNTLWTDNIKITSDMVKKLSGNRWQLSINYTFPLYFNTGKLELEFKSGSLYLGQALAKSQLSIKRASSIPGFEKAPVCKVKNGEYGPYFELNGKPFYYSGGNMGTFVHNDPPTNTVTVGPNSFTYWTDKDTYDFSVLDRAAETARREEGDNYFFWNLTMFVPRKLLERYPDAICRDEKGRIVRDGWPSLVDSHSYGSKEIMEEMKRAIVKAIEYLESSPYANRIIGYRINGGHTIEWLGWEQKGSGVDFSKAAQKDFTEFAKKYYPELKNPTVPSVASRAALDNDKIVWDPQKHLNAIAFNEYYSVSIARYVIEFTKAAREVLKNRKLVGTYFGYAMTLNSNGKSQMRGHYALKTLLDSRCLDFLMSPQPYNVRNFGDTYGDMKPFTSIQKYNIVSLQEDDTRTHLSQAGVGFHQSPNGKKTTQIVRRGMGFTLCRNMPSLFIKLPGHFDTPTQRRDFAIAEKVGTHCIAKQVKRNAQIALVVSEKSICYTPVLSKGMYTGSMRQVYGVKNNVSVGKSYGAPFAHSSFGENYTDWARIGAPADYVLAEDLADNPGNYKLYVFVNCQVYDQKFLKAVEKLRSRNCTLLWMYAPGYTFNNRNSLANMERLTGMKLAEAAKPMLPAATMSDSRIMGSSSGKIAPLFYAAMGNAEVLGRYEDNTPAVCAVKTGRANSIFCGPWKIDTAFAREIARRAGVRFYSNTNDPLEANSALVTLHARTAGKKVITLDKPTDVLDVFNQKIIGRNVRSFTFDSVLHDSRLFYYGDDAEELLNKIK